jgi:vancomycin resistance protein YoaR
VAPLEAGFDIDWLNRIQVTEARPGTLIDLEVLGRLLVQAVENRRALFELPLRRNVEPGFSTEQAKALNIKGLVAQFTTHHPCCQDRVKNIHRIADLVSGSIIKPGETFSLNQLVGLRTADRGFVSAPSIEDGETVDALGGGISQFTTTLFNAAYLGGCELLEWQPHTYWFSRYPMGHEATLSWPKPDLVFRNDFRSGLLIRTAYTPTSITVRLFGDNTDRRVKVDVSPRRDITEPAVELIPNPKLSPEREKVTERGEVGWSVQVTRTVTFTDRAARNEERRVTYKPRPRRIQVHPCRIPRGDPSYTGEPCPVPSDSFEPETPDTAGTEAGER